MSMKTVFAAALTLSLIAGAGAASAACSDAEQKTVGKKVAATVRSELSVEGQTKRLIKFHSCDVSEGVYQVTFTYNYVADGTAYAVEGQATASEDGVTVESLAQPSRVWASIDTYYEDIR